MSARVAPAVFTHKLPRLHPQVLAGEEAAFGATLERGQKVLVEMLAKAEGNGKVGVI